MPTFQALNLLQSDHVVPILPSCWHSLATQVFPLQVFHIEGFAEPLWWQPGPTLHLLWVQWLDSHLIHIFTWAFKWNLLRIYHLVETLRYSWWLLTITNPVSPTGCKGQSTIICWWKCMILEVGCIYLWIADLDVHGHIPDPVWQTDLISAATVW